MLELKLQLEQTPLLAQMEKAGWEGFRGAKGGVARTKGQARHRDAVLQLQLGQTPLLASETKGRMGGE